MVFKKLKKRTKQLGETALVGAGLGIGISALGGQTGGVTSATRFLPATGTVVGAGALIRTVSKLGNTKKKRKSKF